MNEEKQIEEARNLREIGCDNAPFGFCNKYDRCDDCPIDRIATALYTAGYRKQSEGTWVARICEFTDGSIMTEDYYCSKCLYETLDNEKNFCPNCGAKMKGGAE